MKTPCLVALGLVLCATSAWASVGTAPVEILNGTVALTCTNANRILARGASGGVACSDEIPVGVTQDTLTYRGPIFGSIAANDVVTMLGASLISKATTSFPVGVGCFTGGNDGVSQWDVAYSGLTTCAKVSGSGTAIASGARVMQDATDPSKLVTAAASDIGVGIAVAAANDGATTVQVFWGAKQAAVVPVVNFATDGACDTAVLSPALSPVLIASPGSVTVPTGGMVLLTGTVGLSDLGGTGARTLTLGVYRGGTLLTNGDVALTRTATDEPSTMSIAISDLPGAGAFTYTLRISTDGPAANSTVSRCWLTALAVD